MDKVSHFGQLSWPKCVNGTRGMKQTVPYHGQENTCCFTLAKGGGLVGSPHCIMKKKTYEDRLKIDRSEDRRMF